MKLGTLQAGRGIAAICVVLLHTAVYFSDDPRFWRISWYGRVFYFGNYGVEFFFVLSGIVILLAHWKDIGHASAIRSYAWKRFRRIYPIYWVVLIPILLSYKVSPQLGGGFARDPWAVLSSLALFHIRSPVSILHVGWTLFCEILFYLLFAFVILNRRWGSVVLVAWFAGCAFLLFHPTQHWVFWYLLPVQLCFSFGMLVTIAFKKNVLKGEPALLIVGLAVMALAVTRAWRHELAYNEIIAGAGCAMLVAGLIGLERRERLQIGAIWLFLGDASYSIYLSHMAILSVTVRWIYRLHEIAPTPLLYAAEIIIATLGGVLLHVAV